MKKYFIGITALLLAVGFTAFNSKKSNFDDLYWFTSNPGGTAITQPARSDTPSPLDPLGCRTGSEFCSLGYTATQTMDSAGHRYLKSNVDIGDNVAFSQKGE